MKNISERIAELSPEKRALFALLLGKEKRVAAQTDIKARGRNNGALPLSFAQQRLWFLDQLEPGTAFYNIPAAVRLRGALDLDALARSFAELVRRHESLRTTFHVVAEQPTQFVAPAFAPQLPLTDLSHLNVSEREIEVERQAGEEAQRSFDLAAGPLLRLRVLRLSAEEHVLLLTMHHIVSDGWSTGVLIREVATLYGAYSQGHESPLPELRIQYADYAAWQREHLTGEVLEGQLSYWREQLNEVATLELPTDRLRPAERSYRGASIGLTLGVELTRGLRELSRREGATLFMTLLAAFQVLLSRYTNQTDISVGTPIANRNRAETEGLIGFFVNTLVMRTKLDGDQSFAELLRRVRETALGAYANQDVPFEKLVEELQPERDLSHSPLFQVLFTMQNAPAGAIGLPGLKLELVQREVQIATFDLSLMLGESADSVDGLLTGSLDLFDRETLSRFVEHYEALLTAIVANPERNISELQIISGIERERLLVEWNDTRSETPAGQLIHQAFEARAAETPEAVAVWNEGEQLTYGELNRRANQLARRLRRAGVGLEDRVVILLARSPEMIVAVLGVLKAGAAYVPLDAGLPAERLAFILNDTRAKVLLTQQTMKSMLPSDSAEVVCLDADWEAIASADDTNFPCEVHEENLAYVIYTSGSTGEPKGVLIQHGSIKNYVETALAEFKLEASDRVLQFASLSFDTSAEEIYPTLAAGATLLLRNDAMLASTSIFFSTCRDWGVTVLDLPTAYWHELAASMSEEHRELVGRVRLVILGGEKALARRLESWHRHMGGVRQLNGYGPTETTVVVTFYEMEEGADSSREIPIGRPIRNVQAYVLGGRMQPAPIGVPGELYIGGAALSRGYLDRPGLTAERFVPHPFSRTGGARLYRTGDVVKYRADGQLEYTGRADQQVKIRGFRIELGEIEEALAAQAGVREAVVIAREREEGDHQLVAYVVADSNGEEGDADLVPRLKSGLKRTLPSYMVPPSFVVLDELPLTSSGKVDRRRLPAPEQGRTTPDGDYAAPRTAVEEILAGVWADLLNVERVGLDDNFFDLGGHSLLATRLIARVRALFSIELPLRAVFELPTMGALAARIEAIHSDGGGEARPPLTALTAREASPLSFAQQRLWFLDQLEPGNPFYNVSAAVQLTGQLDVAALERSFAEVVRRHESLRTRFEVVDGVPVQVVVPTPETTLPFVDLSALPEEERETAARRLATEEAGRPFDLSKGPVTRSLLLRLSADEHVAVLTMHHIACDAWSVEILVKEIGALYAAFSKGQPSPLAELPVQYADYAHWQRGWLRGEVLEAELAYWTRQLKGAAMLELPTDRQHDAVQTYRGASRSFDLPATVAAALKALGRQAGTTPFMTTLAAFKSLLARYTNQTDISVGTPVANRGQVETEALIGFFLNTLVLRTDLAGDPTFGELVGRVREAALGAYTHQEVPFEKLVEELQPRRDLSRSPLFQVMFVFESMTQGERRGTQTLPGLALSRFPVGSATAKFDLTLSITESPLDWACRFEYNTDLFDAQTIDRLVAHFQTLLEGAVAQPELRLSELPLLSGAERRQLLVEWNDTEATGFEQVCIHELFERQATRTPSAVALVCGEERLTYGELDERANRLAQRLRAHGVGAESLVGVLLGRSAHLVTALLAVLKAGGAYVPLDPAYPQERLRFMLEDSGARVLLTEPALAGALPAHEIEVVLVGEDEQERDDSHTSLEDVHIGSGEDSLDDSHGGARASSANLAYVIYTSGSTGTPKGVAITHQNAATLLQWASNFFSHEERQSVLAATSICFDLSIFELFVPLSWGGRVVLVEDALRLPELSETVTLVNTVPSAMAALVRDGRLPDSVLAVNLAGEPLRPTLAARVYERGVGVRRVVNLYGPTEDTTYSTVAQVSRGARRVTIGGPVAGTQAYVLGGRMSPVPEGVAGELYLGGEGVARGYLNRPALTAERFVPDPFGGKAGARLYGTGDMTRRLNGGEIEYLGRFDHQVKIRGYRIELGEVEAALLGHDAVRDAVVVAASATARSSQDGKGNGNGEEGSTRLVAYLVAREGAELPSAGSWREYLRTRLPDYMIPSSFVTLSELPLTTNGKVDRRSLPEVDVARAEDEGEYVEPRTAVEAVLAGVWQQVLGVERVGAHDNFFERGGHSLLATQVVSRVRDVFEVELPLRKLFEEPTVAGMAEVMLQEPGQRARVEKTAELLLMLEELSEDEAGQMLDERNVSAMEGKA